jgi:hypothetical protein
MGKSKPSQIIVHRLEFQQTERVAMEAALAGKFLTNAVSSVGSVLTGLGNMLKPFEGALTAIAGVYLAEKGWDKLKEDVLNPLIDELQTPVLDRYAGDYSLIVAWLNAMYAMDGWDFLGQDYSSHDAYFSTSEGVSTLWRGNYDQSYGFTKLGALPVGSYQWVSGTFSKSEGIYRMPSWLVDRFDLFISTMKQTAATNKEAQTPAEWFVQFYPYNEFQNEILWRAQNQ